ncbi:DUF6515 family protein [Foetidibacter luteolus]|uniref:DUF6515 family protein n=1 Tax=Foetidibacter luteolus TaxID=2608880 RepID=UPI00129BFE96|nr:DUF6515 family protein [Foetidibacter luteolus]
MRNTIIAFILLLAAVSGNAQPRPHWSPSRGGYGYYRGGGYHYGGPRVVVAPRVMIPYGGMSYYYNSGFFYRPYGASFRIIAPPIGISIGLLPAGYMPVYVGPSLFYYYGGTFYQRNNNNSNYQVVDPPMGAEITQFPRGAKLVVVNGEQFYELNGTYYQRTVTDKGDNVYKVVGKNGEINNSPLPQDEPNVGDTINELPEGCKTITLNGEKYYVSPHNIYYRKITGENNQVSYQVAGKPSEEKK